MSARTGIHPIGHEIYGWYFYPIIHQLDVGPMPMQEFIQYDIQEIAPPELIGYDSVVYDPIGWGGAGCVSFKGATMSMLLDYSRWVAVAPCQHDWVDTGTRKAFCRRCDAVGTYDPMTGEVIV